MNVSSVRNDEALHIDLLKLCGSIWQRRAWFALIVIVCVALAGAYAFVRTPLYESKAWLVPPFDSDIADINYGRTKESSLAPFSVKDVYTVFVNKLNSDTLRREFYTKVYRPQVPGAASATELQRYTAFTRRLTVEPNPKVTDQFSVSLRASDSDRSGDMLKQYIAMASDSATAEVIGNAKKEAQVRAGGLAHQIELQHQGGAQLRADTISRLSEALKIAEAVGLVDPPLINSLQGSELSTPLDGDLSYMRGSKALKAEIENLQQRSSDDPFVTGLREQQQKLAYYSNLVARTVDITVFRYDGLLQAGDDPITLPTYVILIIGLAGGLLLGLITLASVFMLSEVIAQRRRPAIL